ncbi:hypothetical protein SCUCBS95973_002613 [Sporothrix curviconia]|uniref:WIBG Mago-binding domain-containing protein n=1 Tax=Sporothrix curviconia TaxID=1260050 RepID=A0ABP0B8J1_9PEZI
MVNQPTNAGIITDAAGVRHIPESTRADGSTRRAIRIRPGYQPPEDVALYRNRTAENFRNRMKAGVPGAEAAVPSNATANAPATSTAGPSLKSASSSPSTSAFVPGSTPSVPGSSPATPADSSAANKNAKRREARKKASLEKAEKAEKTDKTDKTGSAPPAAPQADPQVEREKKARGLRKKLKQAKELKSKRDDGEALLPEQIAKVIRINELVRELDALGFDTEGEPKTKAGEDKTT